MRFWILLILLTAASFPAAAQLDSLPVMTGGQFVLNAPPRNKSTYNARDLIKAVIRMHKLEQVFGYENEAEYMKDFQFGDINGDGYLDVYYCGQTRAYKGWHTLIFLNKGHSYRKVFDAPGYVQQLFGSRDSLQLRVRQPGDEKDYLSRTLRYDIRFGTDTTQRVLHQVLFPVVSELPETWENPDAIPLTQTTYLRWSPEAIEDQPADLNGDGEPETMGNIIAAYSGGSILFRIGRKMVGTTEWTYVVVVEGKPMPEHILYGMDTVRSFAAGWVPSDRLGKP